LIKTEVSDVLSLQEVVCYTLVSAYNKNYMKQAEKEQEIRQPQQNTVMSSLQTHKLYSNTLSGNNFSVFLAYIF